MTRHQQSLESFIKIYSLSCCCICKKRRKKKTKKVTTAKTQPSSEYCSLRTPFIVLSVLRVCEKDKASNRSKQTTF